MVLGVGIHVPQIIEPSQQHQSSYLYKLIQLPAKVEELSSFYFKINIFRNTFKTEIFSNLDSLDLKAKQIDFHLDIDHISTLKSYFDLHPTLEIQLCNQKSNIFGFVSIFLTHLFSNQSNDDLVNIIEGTFQVFYKLILVKILSKIFATIFF